MKLPLPVDHSTPNLLLVYLSGFFFLTAILLSIAIFASSIQDFVPWTLPLRGFVLLGALATFGLNSFLRLRQGNS